jgi:hypothetical protein
MTIVENKYIWYYKKRLRQQPYNIITFTFRREKK